MDETLDIDTSIWQNFNCDKCGSCSSYAPGTEVTSCFGCECKVLEEMKIECPCGWVGNYFEQDMNINDPTDQTRTCPECGAKGYSPDLRKP